MADHIPIEQISLLFEKILSESELEYHLNVPSKVLKKYPIFAGCSRTFTSLDRNGYAWPFILSIRKPPQYPKPSFVKSVWHPFVVAKHLRAGDVVQFYTIRGNPEAGIQVRAWRNEMGWHHVEDLTNP